MWTGPTSGKPTCAEQRYGGFKMDFYLEFIVDLEELLTASGWKRHVNFHVGSEFRAFERTEKNGKGSG